MKEDIFVAVSVVAFLLCSLCYCSVISYEVKIEPPSNDPIARNKGTVLVRYNSTSPWGTVCDDNWDINDARVVCRMLGFIGADTYHQSSAFGTVTGYNMLLDDVACSGTESNLMACSSSPYGTHNCGSGEQAGVTCTWYEIRLEPPSNDPSASNKGTVLVKYNSTSQWGTVCDDEWDINDATVVCRMLGYIGADAYHQGSAFGTVTGYDMVLDDVACLGSESNLMACSSRPFGTHNCGSGEQAGVTCYIYDVRLEPPSSEPAARNKGTVLVRYNSTSEWGAVCDDNWDINDAKVVCRMLGFRNATSHHTSSAFGTKDYYRIVLDEVNCTGMESSLAHCKSNLYGVHDCSSSEQAGVTCDGYEVKLEPPSSEPSAKNKGTVLVRYNSTSPWGTVCDDGWDMNDARVACRMLGFPGAISYHTSSAFGAQEQYKMMLDEVNCTGIELSLASCGSNKYGEHDCSSREQAGVTCAGYEVRLEPPSSEPIARNKGTVLFRYNSTSPWGTICDDGWDNREAYVVCRMLGFPKVLKHSNIGHDEQLPFSFFSPQWLTSNDVSSFPPTCRKVQL